MSEDQSRVLKSTKSGIAIANGKMTDEIREGSQRYSRRKLTKTEYWQDNTKNKREDVD